MRVPRITEGIACTRTTRRAAGDQGKTLRRSGQPYTPVCRIARHVNRQRERLPASMFEFQRYRARARVVSSSCAELPPVSAVWHLSTRRMIETVVVDSRSVGNVRFTTPHALVSRCWCQQIQAHDPRKGRGCINIPGTGHATAKCAFCIAVIATY